jgi:hypothetical protein
MRKKVIMLVVIAVMAGLLAGCAESSDVPGVSVLIYAGSDPLGDYIKLEIDREKKQVRRINYTTSEDSGWLDYAALPATNRDAQGFSILNRVELGSGKYVLFAEYEQTAVIYQAFQADGKADGRPAYCVLSETLAKSDFYGKAYNWMKFNIDPGVGDDSDMEAGFAAWDAASAQGKMYGAGYSDLREKANEGFNGSGIGSINESGTVKVDDFTWSADSGALSFSSSSPATWSNSVSMTGTGSGTVILDFGPQAGGGCGLAIPQTASKDFSASYAGVYFVMLYEYKNASASDSVNPIKMRIGPDASLKVFEYSGVTTTNEFFTGALQPVNDFTEGPNGEPLKDTFQTASSNSLATSAVVKAAHACFGAFGTQVVDGTSESIIMSIFDPNGRFFGFTMFEKNQSDANDYKIRFGFGIKDPDYSDAAVSAP